MKSFMRWWGRRSGDEVLSARTALICFRMEKLGWKDTKPDINRRQRTIDFAGNIWYDSSVANEV